LTEARERTALVVPMLEADDVLRGWREAHTRDGRAGMWAHVTLLYPFLEPREVAVELESLHAHFGAVQPFSFSLTEVRRWPGGVLWLAPEPEASFRGLAEAVYARYPDRPPYGGAHADVVPHCTVADTDRSEVLDAAEADVRPRLPIAGTAREAWLVELVGGRWSVRARLPFAR
jgi:2'-5' RNA ligase